MNSIIAKLLKTADQDVINDIHKLPEFNQDVLLLTYGLEDEGPMTDEEIVNFISRNYDEVYIRPEMVNVIRDDAIDMLALTDFPVAEYKFRKLDFKFDKDELISWDFIIKLCERLSAGEEVDYDKLVTETFNKESAVYLPSLRELYESEYDLEDNKYVGLYAAASCVAYALKNEGYTIKANISTGRVGLDAVLDFSYLNLEFAKKIVIDSRKEALELC